MRIADSVNRALMQSGYGSVFVNEDDGRVVLSGVVNTPEDKIAAYQLALASSYGWFVFNQITIGVRGGKPEPPPISKTDVSTILIELGKIEGKQEVNTSLLRGIDDKLDKLTFLILQGGSSSEAGDVAAVEEISSLVKALRGKVRLIDTTPPVGNL